MKIPFINFGEIKKVIGALNTANSFNDIKPSLELSVKNITDLVGTDVYNIALDFYELKQSPESSFSSSSSSGSGSGDRDSLLEHLVYLIQQCMVYYAYERYSPYADLETSDAGRKMLVSENKKNPFEWMIDKYDAGLRRDANDLMDRLLEFLNQYKETFPEWKNSENYKLANSLFINNAKTFSGYYPIDRSFRFFLEIAPFIRNQELTEIKPRITSTLFDEIKLQILEGNLSIANDGLLLAIQDALASLTMCEIVMKLSPKIYPESLVLIFKSERMTLNASKSAETLQEQMYRTFRKEAESKLKRLEFEVKLISSDTEEDTTIITTDTTRKFFRL